MENENTVATSRKSGFTLAEVLISSMIFLIVSVGFTAGMLAAIKTNSMAADHYRATTIAMNRIQEARTYPFEDVMRMNSDVLTWITENGVESDSPGNALFRRTTVVSYPADMTNTVEVVVSVILPQPFGRTNLPPVELRTMITSAR